MKIKGLCEVPEGTDTKDMPGAEVTPLPPRSSTPPQLPQLPPPPPPISAVARAQKFRRLTVQSKRRLDTRKRLYRENLQQKQEVDMYTYTNEVIVCVFAHWISKKVTAQVKGFCNTVQGLYHVVEDQKIRNTTFHFSSQDLRAWPHGSSIWSPMLLLQEKNN